VARPIAGSKASDHRIEHVSAGHVDRRRSVKVQIDAGAMRGDDGGQHVQHVAPAT
jgi:hypothetical protein